MELLGILPWKKRNRIVPADDSLLDSRARSSPWLASRAGNTVPARHARRFSKAIFPSALGEFHAGHAGSKFNLEPADASAHFRSSFFPTVLLVIIFLFSLLNVPVFAQGGGGGAAPPAAEPAAGTPPAAPGAVPPAKLSEACNKLLGEAPKIPAPATPYSDDEIMVVLSETIKKEGKGTNCAKLVECLRADARVKEMPEDQADKYELAQLKTNYSYCIVSGKDGLDLLRNYAQVVYTWFAGIVGAVCILIIVVSGIQISLSGLSQEELNSAKERIYRALIGMVVLFLSAFILYTINPVFFQ